MHFVIRLHFCIETVRKGDLIGIHLKIRKWMSSSREIQKQRRGFSWAIRAREQVESEKREGGDRQIQGLECMKKI